LRTAFSVVTGIGFSRFESAIETISQRTKNPATPQMIWRRRRRRLRCLRAACGEVSGVVKVWCIGDSGSGKRQKLPHFRPFPTDRVHVSNHRMQEPRLSDSTILVARSVMDPSDRPLRVFGNQRFWVGCGAFERGQILRCSDIAERNTYIPQKSAPLDSRNW
jgi:hypothetical protein